VLRRVAIAAAVALGALCTGPAAALAHPLLVTSAPAPGAIVPGAPSTLTLAFSESSVPRGSAVTVTGPGSRPIALGRLASSDGGQQLVAALPKKLASGVYFVHWVALGTDGHTTSGTFAFGVAGNNGSLPAGAAANLGAVGTAGRGGTAGGQSVFSVALQWLGILAASLLWGGMLLLVALRRRQVAGADRASRRLARLTLFALFAALGSAVYGLLQQANAGAGGGVDFGLLTASGTGISAIARTLIAVGGLVTVALLARRRPAAQGVAAGLTGLGLLASFGLSGHVLAQGSVPAAIGMAIHVVAAGTWAGGLIALLVLVRLDGIGLLDGARAFAPLAVAGLGLAALTGVIAAIREVTHWYFLFWSGYGRLVIVKVLVVAAASLLGALTALRAARARPARGSGLALGAEVGLVLAVLAVASTLSGLAQGRGQPLPAQRGDLLPGPALANALLTSGPAPVTLAPARPGMNTITLIPQGKPKSILVRLVCGCDGRPVISLLHTTPGANGAYSAQIPVPEAGTWQAYLTVDGQTALSSVALPVGVPGAPGAPVRNVLVVADLSGPGAQRCATFLVGAELAVGRLNGSGGVDGGDKVALEAYDDGGSQARAAAIAQSVLGRQGSAAPIAVLPCGAGAEPAITDAARAGVPTIAGDPATGQVQAARVFRVASDPYADGVAIGQALGAEVLPISARSARVIKVVAVDDAQGRRRLAGLEAELARSRPDIRVQLIPESALTSAGPTQLLALLDRHRTVALVIDATDAQEPVLAAAIHRLPALKAVFAPAPVFASERVLSERFVMASGSAGRLGVVQGASTVAVDSRDGLTLSQALPALFPGESASLESLSGYVTGLALDYGLANGTSGSAIADRLVRPAPFTDAIAQPWRSTDPADGAMALGVLEPNFMASTLLPVSSGGEAYSGLYFPNGAWERPVTQEFGPGLTSPVPPLN
jgi:methionine-rich copper-binding protein CopC/putative copper export protein/ABC-type branched-subunit amino acid transport system substrate-binding protein